MRYCQGIGGGQHQTKVGPRNRTMRPAFRPVADDVGPCRKQIKISRRLKGVKASGLGQDRRSWLNRGAECRKRVVGRISAKRACGDGHPEGRGVAAFMA